MPSVPEPQEQAVLQAHGFHRLTIEKVVVETHDARSFVLAVPEDLESAFIYRAGQFCTFRVRIEGEEYLRSYSMSSAPETDRQLAVTVKRVPGGAVSNWMIDHLHEGDTVEVTRPAGVFCLAPGDDPVIAFCGGSGITPVMSLAKAALASTGRSIRILYANRGRESVIFGNHLEELQRRHAGRLTVAHHLDSEKGYLAHEDILAFVGDRASSDFYICGPQPFMDLVEQALGSAGAAPARIFIERFGAAPPGPVPDPGTGSAAQPDSVTVVIRGRRHEVGYQPGATVLETARRGGLKPPFSCESGTCATCMAIVRKGTVRMRTNEALTDEEVEEGWILTCQALPTSDELVVEYE